MILEVAEVHVSVYGCAKERERTYACVCVQGCVCMQVCAYMGGVCESVCTSVCM